MFERQASANFDVRVAEERVFRRCEVTAQGLAGCARMRRRPNRGRGRTRLRRRAEAGDRPGGWEKNIAAGRSWDCRDAGQADPQKKSHMIAPRPIARPCTAIQVWLARFGAAHGVVSNTARARVDNSTRLFAPILFDVHTAQYAATLRICFFFIASDAGKTLGG